MSIEVFDGASSAALWADAYGDNIVETAITHGAIDWSWHHTTWGVIFEIAFSDEEAWDRFRATSAVQAALDGVPDPVGGLLVYRGRGGGAGRSQPRRPRPLIGSGAAALPVPTDPDLEFGRLLERPARALALSG